MGFFDTKKTTVTQVPLMPDWQLQTGKQLSEFVQKYLSQYQPGQDYTGNRVAGMSAPEQTGMNRLNQFLADPGLGELFGAGQQNLVDTLGGKFADPAQSPFIQSMIKLSNMNLQDKIDVSRRGAGARGSYFTESAIQDENRVRGRAQAEQDAFIGDFINQERGRQLQASPLALAFEKMQNLDIPLAKISASQEFGALPRLLEQAGLESEYQDFIRKQDELSGVPKAGQSLFGTQSAYGVPSVTTKRPSTFMSLLGELSPAVGSYNTHEYGYDVNQSSMSDAMKAIIKMLSAGQGG